MRSDSFPTGMENMTFPAKDGERRKIEFQLGPGKHVVEVKLVTGDGDPSGKPTPPPTDMLPDNEGPTPRLPKPPTPPGGRELEHQPF
jgi:hypothetical protein